MAVPAEPEQSEQTRKTNDMKTIADNNAGGAATKPATKKTARNRGAAPARKTTRQRGNPASKPDDAPPVSPVVHIAPSPKRGQGKAITAEFPGIGAVTLAPDQIAVAGTAWKNYAKLVKTWEGHLKNDDNDRMRGFKVPRAATFTEAVTFLGHEIAGKLFPVQSTGAHKGKKPKKGAPSQTWRICRAALIQWRRENGPFFKQHVEPVHNRILAMQRKLLETHVRAERLLDGQVKVRNYKNTVGLSANKTDKRTLAVEDK